MRSSTSQFDQPIPLSKIRSYFDSWYAIRDGIHQDDFLERNKCIYQSKYRRSPYPLPSEIVIEDGTVKEIVNSEFKPFWQQIRDDPNGEDVGVPIQTELEREEITRKLEVVGEDIARNNQLMLDVNDQMKSLDDEKDDAIRRGAVLGPTSRGRSSKERRRPRPPFPWILALGYTAMVSMAGFEAYQLGLPYYDTIGVDITNLSREWLRNPMGVVSGAGFALSATVGLFILWHLVLRRSSSIARNWDSAGPVMTALQVSGIFTLCCILFAVTFALANMRHGTAGAVIRLWSTQQGQPSAADIGQSVFLFLTLLVPFAAAYIHHQIGQSAYWVRRRDIILKQEQWDREEEERLLAHERLVDRRNLRQQELEKLERQRTLLQNQLQALAQQAQAAQHERQERLVQARHSTEVYARSLLAALKQDRYYFTRAANRCKAEHLVPEHARRHADSQPPLTFAHALLHPGRNGQDV